MFQVNQKVQCWKAAPDVLPEVNDAVVWAIYTVRTFEMARDGVPIVRLYEIDNSHLIGRMAVYRGCPVVLAREPFLDAARFRPLCEPKTESGFAELEKALRFEMVEEVG